MRDFKKNVGDFQKHEITLENFQAVTKEEPPYCVHISETKKRCYAVCPLCENPIQIVGLYKNTPESGRAPYGRHNEKTVPSLAVYDKEVYLDCPYARLNRTISDQPYKRPGNKMAGRIYDLLRGQFDRVIWLLQRDMDIYISNQTAKEMLTAYLADESYFYRVATLYNLPWAFPFGHGPKRLFGRLIVKDSALHQALERECPEARFVESQRRGYVKILPNGPHEFNLQYFFCNFRQGRDADSDDRETLVESVELEVFRTLPDGAFATVYKKRIDIDTQHFVNLINLPPDRAHRNDALLALAAEMMPHEMPPLQHSSVSADPQ